jgi:hypothetical protein
VTLIAPHGRWWRRVAPGLPPKAAETDSLLAASDAVFAAPITIVAILCADRSVFFGASGTSFIESIARKCKKFLRLRPLFLL